MEALLSSGRDPDARDRDGESSLRKAIKYGKEKCVELLLQHGASVFQVADWRKHTPLMMAIELFCFNPQYTQRALNVGLRVIKMLLPFYTKTIDENWGDLIRPPFEFAVKSLSIQHIRAEISRSLEQLISCQSPSEKLALEGITKQLVIDIINSRIEVVKLLGDKYIRPTDHQPSSVLPSNSLRVRCRCQLALFKTLCIVPVDARYGEVFVQLFKSGATFDLLSTMAERLNLKIVKYEKVILSRGIGFNLFKAMILNGLKVDMNLLREFLTKLGGTTPPHACLVRELVSWCVERHRNPLNLLQLSRIAIRKQLVLANKTRWSIIPAIDELQLTPDLASYLKFEGVYNEVDIRASIDSVPLRTMLNCIHGWSHWWGAEISRTRGASGL